MSSLLKSKIESLLFISARSMSLNELSKILDKKKEEVETAVKELCEDYESNERGLEIIKDNYNYQMVSASVNSKVIKNLYKMKPGES